MLPKKDAIGKGEQGPEGPAPVPYLGRGGNPTLSANELCQADRSTDRDECRDEPDALSERFVDGARGRGGLRVIRGASGRRLHRDGAEVERREERALRHLPRVHAGGGEVDLGHVVTGRTGGGAGGREGLARRVANGDLGRVRLVRLDAVHEDLISDRVCLAGVQATGRELVELGDCPLLRERRTGERGERE